ncbi:hypothetical protein RvY_16215 [Ramazzottius varieornatus]|uniref:Uncharacterized protein n=1 Tax=Ramazzottius varieornatus TaxID=947166 RepID=A0A1D1W5D3_RAMVA|nr:hypothetical protein RvY_16215 [Ramazzottius varieornatus]
MYDNEEPWLIPVTVVAICVIVFTGCCIFHASYNNRRRRAYRAAFARPDAPPLPTPLTPSSANMSYYPPNIVVGIPPPIPLSPSRPFAPTPPLQQYVDQSAVPNAVYATRSRIDTSQYNTRM